MNKLMYRTLIFICIFSIEVYAEDYERMHIRAGLDLFPSFLAADMDISEKKGDEGSLLLLIVYTDNMSAAEEISAYLGKIGTIRNIPIRTESVHADSLKTFSNRMVAGIFIAQPIHQPDSLIRFAKDRRAILFSPFKGDVERGVMSGIIVKEKILPYLNMTAVQSSGIRVKEFFIRISSIYK